MKIYDSLRVVNFFSIFKDDIMTKNSRKNLFVKTDYLSSKVSSGGYLKDYWSYTDAVKSEVSEVIRGRIGIMNINRIYGYAHSSYLGTKPMIVKVMINNRLAITRWANAYRPDLIPVVGSAYHGIDIKLNRYMFRRGFNYVRVYAINPQNGATKLIGSGTVRRWI